MEPNTDLLSSKLEMLEKIVNVIQQNMQFNLMLTWTILTAFIAILSFAGYFLIKSLVNLKVEQELEKIKAEIIKETELYIDWKAPYKYSSGQGVVSPQNNEFRSGFDKPKTNSLGYPNRLEVLPSIGNKILKYEATLEKDGAELVIKCFNYKKEEDGYLVWFFQELK